MKSKIYTRDEIKNLSRDELEQIISKSTDKQEIFSIVENAPLYKKDSIKFMASKNKQVPIEDIKKWINNTKDFGSYISLKEALCERTNTPCHHGDDDDSDPYPGWQSMFLSSMK